MIPLNLPNILTLSRIGVLPFMVFFFYLPIPGNHIICALLFMIAGLTDWLDGYLARRRGQTSAFGEFLDPVADKLAVTTALLLFLEVHCYAVFTIPAIIIIGREITISALREWMAEIGKRTSIKVSLIGKFKTFVQMSSLTMLLAHKPSKWQWLLYCGGVFLYIAVGLTLWSMVLYLKAAWPDLSLSVQKD